MNGSMRALAELPSGDLAAGGYLRTAGGGQSSYFARWTDIGIPWVAQKLADGTRGAQNLAAMLAA